MVWYKETSAAPAHGFRLSGTPSEHESVSSLYKQKIDSMFDERRSIVSSHSHLDADKPYYRVNNTVQARIEKMFADMAYSSSDLPSTMFTSHFPVGYLGCVPLTGKVKSLHGLQQPLLDLCVNYCNSNQPPRPFGSIDISKKGLHVRRGVSQPEEIHPFPNIAVWAAVKFVWKRLNPKSSKEFAFLPLIANPDALDKDTLFRPFQANEQAHLLLKKQADCNSPLFVVVMRKNGVPRALELHGFVCASSEDAIVIAARLYQALMAHRERNDPSDVSNHEVTVNCSAAERPGISRVLSEVKIQVAVNPQSGTGAGKVDEKPPLPPPVRPPRRNKKSLTSSSDTTYRDETVNNCLNSSSSTEIRENRSSIAQSSFKRPRNIQKPYSPIDGLPKPPKLASDAQNYFGLQSDGANFGSGINSKKPAGSESSSLFKTVGLNRRHPNFIYKRTSNGVNRTSAIGIKELFSEFKAQEGISSFDEILNVIINSEGMSFNDLKPIYKEFLLKLAFILTKEELFQKSKMIMKKQKKKRKQRKRSRKLLFISGARGIKRAFRRPLSRLRSQRGRNMGTTSGVYPFTTPIHTSLQFNNMLALDLPSESSSSISSNAYKYTKSFDHDLSYKNNIRRKTNKKDRYYQPPRPKKPAVSSTHREPLSIGTQVSDAGFIRSRPPNRSSSGYFSCSECSFDSESCTCVSAEKCYCSLGRSSKVRTCNKKQNYVSSCTCDTDSCFDDEKGYYIPQKKAQRKKNGNKRQSSLNNAMLCDVEKLGRSLSESSLSPKESNRDDWRTPCFECDNPGTRRNSKYSRSLEYLDKSSRQLQSDSWSYRKNNYDNSRNYKIADSNFLYLQRKQFTDIMGLDLLSASSKSEELEDLFVNRDPVKKVLILSSVEPSGRLSNSRKSSSRNRKSKNSTSRYFYAPDHSVRMSGTPLSVKKSAEIAASFEGIQLNITTDKLPNTRTDSSTSNSDNVFYNVLEYPDFSVGSREQSFLASNLENSLGYLP